MILTNDTGTLVAGQITTTTDHNSDYSTVTFTLLPGFQVPTTVTADQYREAVRYYMSTNMNVQAYSPWGSHPQVQ